MLKWVIYDRGVERRSETVLGGVRGENLVSYGVIDTVIYN